MKKIIYILIYFPLFVRVASMLSISPKSHSVSLYRSACTCDTTPPATDVPMAIAWVTDFIRIAQSPAAKTPGTEVSLYGWETSISPLETVRRPSCCMKVLSWMYLGAWDLKEKISCRINRIAEQITYQEAFFCRAAILKMNLDKVSWRTFLQPRDRAGLDFIAVMMNDILKGWGSILITVGVYCNSIGQPPGHTCDVHRTVSILKKICRQNTCWLRTSLFVSITEKTRKTIKVC